MIQEKELRNQLTRMLTIRQAHMSFDDAVANFPAEHINTVPPNGTYSFWHLIEHIRIAQKDILDYIAADTYQAPNFPEGYWPDLTQQTDLVGWQNTIAQFRADLQQLVDIINDPQTDLFAPLPNSGEHKNNLVREINIIASHNAYHTGELGILRQVLELWPEK